MAVRIRLTRVGATKRPAYRVIAIDQRRSRDGRALEILGFYDPLTEPATVQLQTERISAWIGKGAQPSDTVVRLMRQAERAAASPTPAEKPKRPTRASAKPKASKPKAAATAEEPPGDVNAEPAAEPVSDAAADEAANAPPTPDAETAATEAPTAEVEIVAEAADGPRDGDEPKAADADERDA